MVVGNVLKDPANNRFNREVEGLGKYRNVKTPAADTSEFREIL